MHQTTCFLHHIPQNTEGDMKKILSVLCALMMSLSPFTAAPSFFAADVSAAAASDTTGDQKIGAEK